MADFLAVLVIILITLGVLDFFLTKLVRYTKQDWASLSVVLLLVALSVCIAEFFG